MSAKYSRTLASTSETYSRRVASTNASASTTASCPMLPYAVSGTTTADAVVTDRIARMTVDIISQRSYR